MTATFELTLIRHAQSANNALPESQRVDDPSITEMGEKQAERLAERFRDQPITHCLTSGFLRAIQTMRPLAQAVDVRPTIWTDLHEVGGCFAGFEHGKLEGRPGMNRETLSNEFPEFELPDDIDELGWWKSKPFEDYTAAQHRAEMQAKRLLAEFSGSDARVVCVIHADFKALMLEALLKDTASVSSLDLFNTGVTVLHCSEDAIVSVDVNDVVHLPRELVTS